MSNVLVRRHIGRSDASQRIGQRDSRLQAPHHRTAAYVWPLPRAEVRAMRAMVRAISGQAICSDASTLLARSGGQVSPDLTRSSGVVGEQALDAPDRDLERL